MIFTDLLSKLKTDTNFEDGDLINQAGLLLERHYYSGQDGSTFLLVDGLAQGSITEEEADELIDALLYIASSEGCARLAAIWAIGKTCRSDVVNRIISIVKNSNDDDTVYQTLVACEDCDISQAWEFICKVAQSSLPKSKEFALRKLELKSMGIYDEK